MERERKQPLTSEQIAGHILQEMASLGSDTEVTEYLTISQFELYKDDELYEIMTDVARDVSESIVNPVKSHRQYAVAFECGATLGLQIAKLSVPLQRFRMVGTALKVATAEIIADARDQVQASAYPIDEIERQNYKRYLYTYTVMGVGLEEYDKVKEYHDVASMIRVLFDDSADMRLGACFDAGLGFAHSIIDDLDESYPAHRSTYNA